MLSGCNVKGHVTLWAGAHQRYQPAKFGGHRHSGIGDMIMIFLVCHVTLM